MPYGVPQQSIERLAGSLIGLGWQYGERIATYLEKGFETIVASFGVTVAGCVFVPRNPNDKIDRETLTGEFLGKWREAGIAGNKAWQSGHGLGKLKPRSCV